MEYYFNSHSYKNNQQVYLINAKDQSLGRLVTKVARLLIGRDKINNLPFLKAGDKVIVFNLPKATFLNIPRSKSLYSHSGFIGGLKKKNIRKLFEENPDVYFYYLVKKMLPGVTLKREVLKNLTVSNYDFQTLKTSNKISKLSSFLFEF
jgi:large subunit ribosomal protein L13